MLESQLLCGTADGFDPSLAWREAVGFDLNGIFSMGLRLQDPSQITGYESANQAALRRAVQELDLVYYAMGKDDFLYGTVTPTRAMLTRHGVEHINNESDGGSYVDQLATLPGRLRSAPVPLTPDYLAIARLLDGELSTKARYSVNNCQL